MAHGLERRAGYGLGEVGAQGVVVYKSCGKQLGEHDYVGAGREPLHGGAEGGEICGRVGPGDVERQCHYLQCITHWGVGTGYGGFQSTVNLPG